MRYPYLPPVEAAVVAVVSDASSLDVEGSERFRVPRLMIRGRSGLCLRRVGKSWLDMRLSSGEGESGMVRGVDA